MSFKIDKTDRRILKLLQRDANLSTIQISDKIGLSQSPCWRRINRLEEEGIITGQVAKLDREKLGLKVVVFVHINLSAHGRTLLDEFEESINEMPEVLECYTVLGEVDYLLKVVTEDIMSFETFYKKKLAKLPGIQSTNSSMVLTEVKNTNELPL